MATLTYNGIAISLMQTLGLEHQPIRDLDGSYLYTRLVIDVAGMIYGGPSPSQNPAIPNPFTQTVNPQVPLGEILQGIRHALLQERAQLIYDLEDGSGPAVVSPAPDGNGNPLPCDCNNGPIPEVMSLNHVSGISSIMVRFRVTTFLRECPGVSGTPDALLSNRSYQTHSVGEQHLSTITTVGQATFRTDVLEEAQNQADHYRYLLFGPVPKGCKRVAINIQATPTRNTLTYQVVDQERFFDIGETGPTGSNSGIVDVKFEYGTSSTGQAGAPVSPVTAHNVSITVVGNKSASHWGMTQAAFALAQTKLPIFDATQGFLTSINVRQVMHDRVVSLNATMLLMKDNGGGAIPGLNTDGLQVDAVFAPAGGVNPAMPSRSGTAVTYQNELITTAWKSACAPPTKAYEGKYYGDSNAPYNSSNTGPVVTVSVNGGSTAPTLNPKYSAAQSLKPYLRYKLDMKVQAQSGVMQVPNAGNSNSTAASSSSPPATCSFLTLSYPTEQLLVQFEAERIGTPPSVPAFTSTDSNRVLLTSWIQPAEPQLMTDGVTRIYTVMGGATYGLKKPFGSGTGVNFPQSPMQTGSYGDQAITPDMFIAGIVDPIQALA